MVEGGEVEGGGEDESEREKTSVKAQRQEAGNPVVQFP